MYAGGIVEGGHAPPICTPAHPYSRGLWQSPRPRSMLLGRITSAIAAVCAALPGAFHPRASRTERRVRRRGAALIARSTCPLPLVHQRSPSSPPRASRRDATPQLGIAGRRHRTVSPC